MRSAPVLAAICAVVLLGACVETGGGDTAGSSNTLGSDTADSGTSNGGTSESDTAQSEESDTPQSEERGDGSEPGALENCLLDGVEANLGVTSAGLLESADGFRYCVGPATMVSIDSAQTSDIAGVGPAVLPLLAAGKDGIDAFNELAAACFVADPSTCPTKQVAIVVDGQIISAPAINADRFERDQLVIARDFGFDETGELAAIIDSQQSIEFRPVLFNLGPLIDNE